MRVHHAGQPLAGRIAGRGAQSTPPAVDEDRDCSAEHQGERRDTLSDLRRRILDLDRSARAKRPPLPFGIPTIDAHLPWGGLPLGRLHEFVEHGLDSEHAAAATLFVGGILARLKGTILWCLKGRDLFAPALGGIGLHPDRVIYVETDKDRDILAAMEEGLRFGGLGAVVGEVGRLSLTASRRLQLAAEASGVPGLVVRRWRNDAEREARHYALIYGQDGPVQVFEGRKRRSDLEPTPTRKPDHG